MTIENRFGRALLTQSQRERFRQDWSGKPSEEKKRLYQSRSRLRSRLEVLKTDLRLLYQHEPELFEETVAVLADLEIPESEIPELPTVEDEAQENSDSPTTVRIELDPDQREWLDDIKDRRGYTWKGLLLEGAEALDSQENK